MLRRAAAAEAGEQFVLQLAAFEGPLDLLLHLLDEQQLDITEVSLLAVTKQYLAHLRAGEQLDLDALAEFIAVGARLLLLKSRALLPRDPSEEPVAGEDEADPLALVARLQEYRRFKEAAEFLRALELEHRHGYRRAAAPPELPPAPGLEGVTLTALVLLLQQALERVPAPRPEPAVVPRERVRLADCIAALAERVAREGRVSFRALIGGATTRVKVIVEFLAVLELIKARVLEARQTEAFGDIELVRVPGDAVAATLDDALVGA
ncbi:MAG: segregation/condensation protein A [Chloroflexi bacterium]|nr:segregation/condensation protein A [Chloroflexota bacterium]